MQHRMSRTAAHKGDLSGRGTAAVPVVLSPRSSRTVSYRYLELQGDDRLGRASRGSYRIIEYESGDPDDHFDRRGQHFQQRCKYKAADSRSFADTAQSGFDFEWLRNRRRRAGTSRGDEQLSHARFELLDDSERERH